LIKYNGSASEIEIFDGLGKRIWNEKLNGETSLKFVACIFQPGLYHFAIVNKNKGIIDKGKIVVK